MVLNTIVNNDWIISEPLFSFYDDRLEITSHGGLPKVITKQDFFNGISHAKNSVLMRIFLKLGIVEHTATEFLELLKNMAKKFLIYTIHILM